MNSTNAAVSEASASADFSAADSYYSNPDAKNLVNATLSDVSDTFGIDTSILSMLLGADSTQEASATAEAIASQVNPADVVSQVDASV